MRVRQYMHNKCHPNFKRTVHPCLFLLLYAHTFTKISKYYLLTTVSYGTLNSKYKIAMIFLVRVISKIFSEVDKKSLDIMEQIKLSLPLVFFSTAIHSVKILPLWDYVCLSSYGAEGLSLPGDKMYFLTSWLGTLVLWDVSQEMWDLI